MRFVLPKIQKDKVFDVMARANRTVTAALFGALLVVPFAAKPVWAKCSAPTNGLVGYWKLDETSGTTAADSSGNGYNGSMINGLSGADSIAGAVGTAIDFPGGTEKIEVSDNALDNLGTMSVCAWRKMTSSSTSSVSDWMYKSDLSSNGWELLWNRSPTNYRSIVHIHGDVNEDIGDTSSAQPDRTQWNHYCFTYDPAGGSDKIKQYFNNILISATEFAQSGSSDDSAYPLTIGDQIFASYALDDIRMYDRVLSASEVAEVYADRAGIGATGGTIIFNSENAAMQYCDGTDWRMMGIGSYNPNAVVFSSATPDYLDLDNLDMNFTNGQKGTLSVWFKTYSMNSAQYLIENQGTRFALSMNQNQQRMGLSGRLADGTTVLSANTDDGGIVTGQWYHFLASWDLSEGLGPATCTTCHLYIDGVEQTGNGFSTYSSAGAIDYVRDLRVGIQNSGNNQWDGEIADLWLDFDTNIDFSKAENRRKFISDSGMPMYLGPDGSIPTGTAPTIFLSSSTAGWHVNNGTGGPFIEFGALSYSSSRPGDLVIANSLTNYIKNESFEDDTATATSYTHTFAFTPTSGNLLVATMAWDKVITGLSETSGNWTQVAFNSDGANTSAAMYYKISDGTEADISLSWTNAEEMSIWVGELQGFVTSSVLNQSANANSGGTAVTSQSTGTTGATTAANTFAIAAFSTDTGANTNAGRSYTNGFTEQQYVWQSLGPGLAVATKVLSSTGTVESTFSTTDTGDQMAGIMGVFEIDPTINFDCDANSAGKLQYNADFSVMEYCNGAEFVAMGPIGGTPPTNGLVAYWKMDETSGTTAADSSGNGNNATVTSGTPTWSTGILGNSVADAWFSSVNPTGLSSTAVTVSVWAKVTTNFDWNDAISFNWGSGTGGYNIRAHASGWIGFGVMNGGTQENVGLSNGVRVGEWMHWVGTYDGFTVKIYVDGVLVDQKSAPGITLQTTGNFYVSDGAGNLVVDDARVYNRALSAQEVMQLYRFTKSGGLGDVDNGCTNPARPEGTMLYNADNTLMQYCNGEEWIKIGH